ncbi:extracellular salicylate hydroxylase/monooxygenase [Ophiocordyceps camponoti-floridani]|uniref:Extracellular salicylate hydroxylase/monooxygenase n=1 Tax=Ophiocordyceps camponoti-floridani TaxID=2030778 RepID=A0A8H4VBM3_9HYPO|nr:extracellular salicylate hydroxylase/monooxygenase [Ophiocordyceps camponoti-floridani]
MKIVIVGAGISGCGIYLLLKKHLPKPLSAEPHDITIYEAYDTDKDTTASARGQGPTHSSTLVVGGGLGVGANGLNVLKRLDEDILRDVVSGGYIVPTMKMKTKGGTVLARVQPSGNGDGNADNGMNMVASSRHWLWRCLRNRVPDDAIVNKTVTQVVAKGEGRNVVRFVDGTSVEADMVIGADGLNGLTKNALFPEAGSDPFPPIYEGLVGVGGFIPSSEVRHLVEKGTINFVFGGNGFFGYFFADSAKSDPNRESPYHVSEPGESLGWWSTYSVEQCPTPETLDPEAVTRQLRERHGNWKDPVVQKVLETMQVKSMYPTWTVSPLPTWERNGIVIVGDAAHALPPTSGQGSSQSLEDAEALTLFLCHHLRWAYREHRTDVASRKELISMAAKQYMELRLPRVTKILREAQSMQSSKRNMTTVQEYAMYLVMWIMGYFPSLVAKPLKAVIEYNVAEEVKKILGKTD